MIKSLEERQVRWSPRHVSPTPTPTPHDPNAQIFGPPPGASGQPGDPGPAEGAERPTKTPIIDEDAWLEKQLEDLDMDGEGRQLTPAELERIRQDTRESIERTRLLRAQVKTESDRLQSLLDQLKADVAMTAAREDQLRQAIIESTGQLLLARERLDLEEKKHLDGAGSEDSKALIKAALAKANQDNQVTKVHLDALRIRSVAETSTFVALQETQLRINALRHEEADLVAAKTAGYFIRTESQVLEGDPDALTGDATGPITRMVEVKELWTEEHDRRLLGVRKGLQALTGERVIGLPVTSAFGQTATQIAHEAEKDRELQRTLTKERLMQDVMLADLGNQLTVAVANGRMTADAALIQYQERSEDARFRVRTAMEEAELLYGEVASTRLYAAAKIQNETDLTKWLLERRVDPSRTYLRAPGTPVGGPEGQLLQPVFVDPSAIAERVDRDMQLDVQSEQAAESAARAVAASKTDVGTVPMPETPTITVTNAADLPTAPAGV